MGDVKRKETCFMCGLSQIALIETFYVKYRDFEVPLCYNCFQKIKNKIGQELNYLSNLLDKSV